MFEDPVLRRSRVTTVVELNAKFWRLSPSMPHIGGPQLVPALTVTEILTV